MPIFSYSITDLADHESKLIEVALENDAEALAYGTLMAREMLAQMPDLTSKGMCVTVYDGQGETISIVPLDPIS